MYRAKCDFADLMDNRRLYKAGETYPRAGLEVSEKRLTDLLKGSNKAGRPLIEEIPDPEPKKPTKPRRSRRKDS